MNCSKCGAPLRDGAQFCSRCGAPVSAFGADGRTASAPRSPFEPAQRTADRVFPSQQRKTQPSRGAPQGNAAPDAGTAQQQSARQTFDASSYGAPPFGASQRGSMYGEVPSGALIDWEHFQPRRSPKSANRLILAASVLIFALVVMIWTLLIQ